MIINICIYIHASDWLSIFIKDAAGSGFAKLLWLTLHARKIIILVILYRLVDQLLANQFENQLPFRSGR